MAKLLSHHDRLHVHAILGLAALAHFFLRFVGLFVFLRDTFTTGAFSAASLMVHVLLHATSFQFDLPRNRQWSKPMIWREFRIHNAIFAYRHLVGSALGIWCADWWWRNPVTISSLLVKVAILWLTCKAADIATAKVGSRELRTTNAMPYPPDTPGERILMAKHFYAKSQFAAASLAVFGCPVLSFASILAIEIASFMMTLVRKGIVSSTVYHLVYSAALFIMFPAMVVTLHFMGEDCAMATFRAMCATAIAVRVRMKMRWSRYLTWALSVVGGALLAEALAMVGSVQLVAWVGASWSAGDTLMQLKADAKNGNYLEESAESAGRPKEETEEVSSANSAEENKPSSGLSRRGPQGGS
mmetsp:Transcript_20037/g.46654  ORF Transcript_20037/g.46654 Transcript_20037/m.46654 type:complete len:357 (-) Transcript_20037:317-1387(-)